MTPSCRPRIGILSAWASRLGGGVFEATVAHAELLGRAGFDPVMFALEDAHSAADAARYGETPVVTVPVRGPGMIGYAPGLVPALRDARLDMLHLHGIWMYPSAAGAAWAKTSGRPYLVSPHGMLDPWIVERGRAKKAVARIGYERRSWRRATLFHALTDAEADDIARATGRTATTVIPNPVARAAHGADPDDGPYALYLGRIHPKKNVAALVDAWRASADRLRPIGARLLIAGWGDPADVAALEAQIGDGDGGTIRFLGPVYDAPKARLLADARFLVLPSHSEGLPVTVLEGWAAGTPSLMSAHCHLPEGFAAGAAIDTGTDIAGIAAALQRGFALAPAAWRAMSAAASALATGRFSPDAVAARWTDVCHALLSGKAPAR